MTTAAIDPTAIAQLLQSHVTISKRIRVNVSTTSKGIKSYDCTVDAEGLSMEEVLAESDRLVQQLDIRYPAQVS
jgi:hypothetical protein